MPENMRTRILAAILIFTTIPTPLRSDEMYNFAQWWSNLSVQAKHSYIDGVKDAVPRTYLSALNEWIPKDEQYKTSESERVSIVRRAVFLMRFTSASIVLVMTDLYKDPSNMFIDTIDMVYVARDKLNGENIEGRLTDARKAAVKNHELNEKMKRN
jgi:hypothetical protein